MWRTPDGRIRRPRSGDAPHGGSGSGGAPHHRNTRPPEPRPLPDARPLQLDPSGGLHCGISRPSSPGILDPDLSDRGTHAAPGQPRPRRGPRHRRRPVDEGGPGSDPLGDAPADRRADERIPAVGQPSGPGKALRPGLPGDPSRPDGSRRSTGRRGTPDCRLLADTWPGSPRSRPRPAHRAGLCRHPTEPGKRP